ncbi:hypothetical protein HY639_02835 [Candidatus Woesearchaeota archaeon]|nr:hypothetical protein [Candidatus Woesearchaeota archaeon]
MSLRDMGLYPFNLREKIGFSCSSWIGPCEISYEIVSRNDKPIELVSCYLKNYRWVLYLRDYNNDGQVDYLTIVKDLHPFIISRNRDGTISYDKEAFTSEQANFKLAQADWLWKQAFSLLHVRTQLDRRDQISNLF